MKRLFIVLFLSVLVIGCSEKSKVYDIAKEAVKERLKAPSSAKFESYDSKFVAILDSAGSANPAKEAMGLDTYYSASAEIRKNIDKEDNTPYSLASVTVNYEAQNSFGVFLKSFAKVTLQKWNYKDGSKGDWKVLDISEI